MILDKHKLIFIHIIKTAGVSIEKQFNQPTHDHATAMEYKTRLGHAFKDYFSFTIVRNPWDKMVSQFFFNGHKWVEPGTTFKEYIQLFAKGKQISRYSPFHLPYITDDKGEIIVDYIGKFESLNESMKHVYNKINIPYQILPHENKSQRKDYRSYYDSESIEIVSQLFQEEIKIFNYTFEG